METRKIIELLAKTNRSEVETALPIVHAEVFDRTDCLQCGNCCKSAPPIITRQDIKRISKHLNMSNKQFVRKYVLEDINGELSFNVVPCSFLQKDNKCSIYDIRPTACRDFPHTTSSFFKRKNLHINNAPICPAVRDILSEMEKKFLS